MHHRRSPGHYQINRRHHRRHSPDASICRRQTNSACQLTIHSRRNESAHPHHEYLAHPIHHQEHNNTFHITTPNEAKNIKRLSTAALKVLTGRDSEQALEYVNELLKTTEKPETSQQFWFPTPDNPGDPSTHTPVQRRILREIEELEDIQKLNPTTSQQDRQKFFENFKWDDSQLDNQDRKDIENILVEYHDIFARHRLDIGVNQDLKIKLTPKNDQPAYTQCLPCPVNLEDLTEELALTHYYGIITTLPFSKYASPIFAQRKPNGRLRLLVDIRKI